MEKSLSFIPQRSRLLEALRNVLDLHGAGVDWDHARDEIEVRYGHYSSVHTINNAAVVAAALLWRDGDFTQAIGLAVQGGWDTDCTGATTGSIFGVMFGVSVLPSHWVEPLNDRIRRSVGSTAPASPTSSNAPDRSPVARRARGSAIGGDG